MFLSEAYQLIRSNSTDRDRVIHYIYHNKKIRSSIEQFILKSGGQRDDADQIFSEMIIQCIKTIFSRPAFVQEGTLDAYLMGIAKFLWLAEIKKKKMHIALDQQFETSLFDQHDNIEHLFFTQERSEILQELLAKLRGNCREVLMYWANGFNMQEIAKQLNYQSEGMARKKKSHCLKELLEYLAKNPHLKNLLWN